MSDPTRRLNDFLAALPTGPERTQALVDFNALLADNLRNLRSISALERERARLAAIEAAARAVADAQDGARSLDPLGSTWQAGQDAEDAISDAIDNLRAALEGAPHE